MRTDVKIGVAVGLLFVIAVIAYYAIFGSDSPSADPNGAANELARTDGTADQPPAAPAERPGAEARRPVLPRFGGLTAPEPPAPSTPPGTPAVVTSRIPEPPVVPEAPVVPVVRETAPPEPEPVVTAVIRETPVAPAVRETRVTPVIRDTTPPETPITPVIRETPPFVTPIIPIVTETVGPAAAGAEETYVVQKGDAGFWAVAVKAYGDGRYWTLIAKANPDADSNALRAGQKLKIPPKPAPRPAAVGALTAAATGRYVVQKGDAGFWGIAQKVYGDGKRWAVIARANPKVNSSSLKPGQTLIVPPKATGPASRPAVAGPITAVAPGQKRYVVQKGDAGFWGVAQKVYGNGKYWSVLAKANPSVNSSSLKVGQGLVVPELTNEVRRTMSAPATTRTGSPRRVRDVPGRPVFD